MALGIMQCTHRPPPPAASLSPAPTIPSTMNAPTTKTYRIAVLPGAGIGKEVMPEGVRAIQAAAPRFGCELQVHEFEWARCDYYAAHGKMMPDDWKAQL